MLFVLLPVIVGVLGDVCVCVLQDIAVEAAFPRSGICRVSHKSIRGNEEILAGLQDGTWYSKSCDSCILSGSRPEGLAMDDRWGHDSADTDEMYLFGGNLGVHVPGGQQPRGKSCLEFRPMGCPAAYTKLHVTDLAGLKENDASEDWIEESIHRSGNECWLDTFKAVRGMPLYGDVSGPAAQDDDGTEDHVATLVCNRPHPDLQREFLNRPRQWPSDSLISVLVKLPMLLVLVGHKFSPDFNLQARTSWSHLELKLTQELPESVRQGYIACKYVLKHFLKARGGQNETGDGRSHVCSYHIKTLLLRYLEKTPSSMTMSPFRLFLDLFNKLNGCLKVGYLPHYFLPDCNLLETVADDELCNAQEVIKAILSDPLNALLTSPTDPQHIYGEVRPDYLVLAFRRVSSHPTCKQSRKDLRELLACVDETRRQRYSDQREWDGLIGVSGRAKLIGLVDMLKQMKRH